MTNKEASKMISFPSFVSEEMKIKCNHEYFLCPSCLSTWCGGECESWFCLPLKNCELLERKKCEFCMEREAKVDRRTS